MKVLHINSGAFSSYENTHFKLPIWISNLEKWTKNVKCLCFLYSYPVLSKHK